MNVRRHPRVARAAQLSRRQCLHLGGAVWLGVGSGALHAAPAVEPASVLLQWLTRVHDGAHNRNYQGTMVFTAGGSVSSSRVQHFCAGSQRYERVEMLDGQARQVLRHNEEVKVLWPRNRVVVVEPRDPVAAFPALGPLEPRAAEAYDLRLGAVERVAGHDAQALRLTPRDNLRFAQALWVEPASGLLLRADLIGPRGETLESSAFSDIVIDAKPQPQAVLGPMKKLDGFKVVRAAATRTHLEAEGWTLARSVPGFTLVDCLKRPLDAGPTSDAPAAPAVQAVFADGLTHVSVFIERFDAQHHKPLRTAVGASHTMAQAQGDSWITVVGEVPMVTVELFAAALKRRA